MEAISTHHHHHHHHHQKKNPFLIQIRRIEVASQWRQRRQRWLRGCQAETIIFLLVKFVLLFLASAFQFVRSFVRSFVRCCCCCCRKWICFYFDNFEWISSTDLLCCSRETHAEIFFVNQKMMKRKWFLLSPKLDFYRFVVQYRSINSLINCLKTELPEFIDQTTSAGSTWSLINQISKFSLFQYR